MEQINRTRSCFFAAVMASIFISLPFTIHAGIYRWTDEEGILHATDDPSNIPQKYWKQEWIKKEEVKPAHPKARPAEPDKSRVPPEEGKKEVYGDYPIDWWVGRFKGLKKEISDNKERLERDKNFVAVFEGGRRFGKIFAKEEVSRYESSKAEISLLEEGIKKLKNELDELKRKAVTYGVPRNIRE